MTPPLARIGRWPAVGRGRCGRRVRRRPAGRAGGARDAGRARAGRRSRGNRWRRRSPAACSPALGFIGFASLELFVVYVVSRLTRGFSQRLWLAIVVVVALECAASLVQGRSNPAGALVSGLIAGVAAASVLLLLLRYDPRLVPAFAATRRADDRRRQGRAVGCMAAVRASTRVVTDRRGRVAHALSAARNPLSQRLPERTRGHRRRRAGVACRASRCAADACSPADAC